MLESPASPDVNTGEFEAMSEKGDVLGIYVGHDHNNSFVVKYKGVDLGYTQGAGFNVYGPGENRGVRIFELDVDCTSRIQNPYRDIQRTLRNKDKDPGQRVYL